MRLDRVIFMAVIPSTSMMLVQNSVQANSAVKEFGQSKCQLPQQLISGAAIILSVPRQVNANSYHIWPQAKLHPATILDL
jgi:hypothetical protein